MGAGNTDLTSLMSDLNFEAFGLHLILQLLHTERRTAVLRVAAMNTNGYLAFKDGQIVDARFKDLSGYKAAIIIITLQQGQIRLCLKTTVDGITITEPFARLLEVAARYEEDRKKHIHHPAAGNKEADERLPDFAGFPGIAWCGVISGSDAGPIACSSSDIADEITALCPYFNTIISTCRDNASAFRVQGPPVLQITGKFGYFLLMEYWTADRILVIAVQKNSNVESIVASLLKTTRKNHHESSETSA